MPPALPSIASRAPRRAPSAASHFLPSPSHPSSNYLITFSLTLATIHNPDYVRADLISVGPPETAGQFLNVSRHASLWHTCTVASLDDGAPDSDPANFREDCPKRAFLGDAGLDSCRAQFADVTRICPKVVAAAELYTAAAVLSGVAFLVAALHALVAVGKTGVGPAVYYRAVHADPSKAGGHGDGAVGPGYEYVVNNAVGAFSALLALGACMCLVLGQILGVSALVVEGSPSISEPVFDISRWYMSKGAFEYTSSAYALGFFGVFIAVTGCGLWR